MNFTGFVIAIWSVRIVSNIASYIHLWYLKEYRFDRMFIHLKSPQGKKIFFLPFRRPPVRPKTIIIFFCSLVFLSFLPGSIVLKLLFADLLSFPVVSIVVLVTKIPTFLYHANLIRRATAKLRAHTPMTVIGITGSYGKTSTKEILRTLLSQKYSVLATEASKNSPVAIAELVLTHMKNDTQIFIVEMGAYKKGEIASMCRMVKPEIGIVLSINVQHQDLFGSIENTVEAKYELLAGLTGRRIAIMNKDNTYVEKMGKRAAKEGCKVIGYSRKHIHSIQNENGLQFDSFSVHLFGMHQISNILAAVEAAQVVGMTRPEIIQAAKKIRPFPHTMNPIQGIHGSLFIDDTFNNNPDAAIAALEYLKTQAGRKILVFQPMIELGRFAIESHKKVAQYAKTVCDEIIFTNDSYADIFSAKVLSAEAAASYLKKTIKPGDSVLFKGKEAGRVLQLLI